MNYLIENIKNLEVGLIYNYNRILDIVWTSGISFIHKTNFINNIKHTLNMNYIQTMEIYKDKLNKKTNKFENKKILEIKLLVAPAPFNYAKILEIKKFL